MNVMFKKMAAAVLCAAMILPMGAGALAATPVPTAQASAEAAVSGKGIFVSANGEIEADPDYAVVSLGVNTTEKTSAQARSKNAETVKKISEALKKQGVDEKDIQNEFLSMYPAYDYTSEKRTLIGYTVNNTLSVKIRNLDKLGETVNAALNAGANNLNNVYYDVNDRDAYYAKAVNKAMSSAKKKAEIIAKESGLTLGKVTSVNESGYRYPEYYGSGGMMMDYAVDDATAEAAPKTDLGNTLKPSPVTISVSLSVSFSAS